MPEHTDERSLGLPELRKHIDEIDTQIIELLNQRADYVHQVGEVKKATGSSIYAPDREEQLLQSLVQKSKGRLPAKSIRAIYREIMSASLAREKDLCIAYLGPEATWTHQAARSKFGASVGYSAQASIRDVFSEVERGRADYGVVPIENSTEGAVNYTLDVFIDSQLRICAQILLKIENNLIANIPREEIRRVYSHPQVFGQCRQWLQHHLPHAELVEVSSTTRAAALARENPNSAALAGRMAAEVYGLNILEASVQDSPNNTTRFLVIGHETCPPTGCDKTSLMFSVQDKPGALFAALEPLNRWEISMSKIESRPSKRKAWEYVFFVDIAGHCKDDTVVQALEELQKHCTFVKILGSYPNTEAGKDSSR
jgi:chorismate mutase/prephenate dehydratase